MKLLTPFIFLACQCGPSLTNDLIAVNESELISFTPGARKGVHGMVVFGDPQAGYFMSHIPMFHKPHDVQVVFAVQGLEGQLDDRSYTFKPSSFSLDDAIMGTLPQIEGELFEGNFEADGVLLKTVSVRVLALAIPAKLLKGPTSAPSTLTYDVVGGRYLVHPIHAPHDFDQILVLQDPVTDPVVAVSVPNDLQHRLVAGSPAAATVVAYELSTLLGPDFVAGP